MPVNALPNFCGGVSVNFTLHNCEIGAVHWAMAVSVERDPESGVLTTVATASSVTVASERANHANHDDKNQATVACALVDRE